MGCLCLSLLHCPLVETVALVHSQKHQTPVGRSLQDHSAGLHKIDLRNDAENSEYANETFYK